MKSQAKQITQPGDWWEAFREQADKEGRTLSEWIGRVAVERLPARARRRLSERPRACRPKGDK